MKIKIALILLLVIGLIFVAGCSSSSDYGSGSAPSGPVGGGCGVIGPEDTNANNAVEKINSVKELF
ncbi:MAG: hypothetical protein Q7J54_04185 [Candidatus Woesearchaeota archaeon]|nr:hypothetical protein [Candidatus Woesearchaeota archaeon]